MHTANAGLAQYADYIEMIGTEFIGHDPLGDFDVEVDPAFDDVLPRMSRSFRVQDECYNMDIKTEAPLRWFQHGIWKLERKPFGLLAGITGRDAYSTPPSATTTAPSSISTSRTS